MGTEGSRGCKGVAGTGTITQSFYNTCQLGQDGGDAPRGWGWIVGWKEIGNVHLFSLGGFDVLLW